MSIEENKKLVMRFVDGVVNEGHIDLISELFAPDFIEHSLPPGRRPNLDGIKQTFFMLRKAFPDISQTVDVMVAEDDMVAFCGKHICTHLGTFQGASPTGKPIRYTEFHMVRIADGQFVEHWSEVDRLGLYQQLGIIPAWSNGSAAIDQPDPGHATSDEAHANSNGHKPASPEETKAIMRRFFAEVWSKGNMDVVDELISPAIVPYDPLRLVGPGDGPEGVKRLVGMLRSGFPDMNTTPEQIVVEGEWAMTRWTGTGTHDGPFMKHEPSGKKVTVTGMSITRLRGGQFIEAGDSWDTLGLLQQLGYVDAKVR